MALGVEVKFGTPLHDRILKEVTSRFQLSYRKMSDRHKIWQNTDELFQAYVKETDEDAKRRAKRESGQPQYTTITVPYSYAMLLAAHTYWSSVFLSRSPVFQFTGRHGEAQQKIQAVEAVMDYQVLVGEMLVPLYIWLLDAGKYGFGVLGNYWADEKQQIVQIVEKPVTFGLGDFQIPVPGKFKKVKERTFMQGYKGNKLYNVRPYEFFPDPRVSLVNLQKGEFCGRLIPHLGWNEVMRKQASGEYFNVDRLNDLRQNGKLYSMLGSSALNLPMVDDSVEFSRKGSGVEVLEMTVELIPKEWELGTTSYPEKWVFTVSNISNAPGIGGSNSGGLVIGCEPLGAIHNRFPFLIQSYEIDGYSHHGRGMMEIGKPLNDVMTWLINSHFFNVRKALNDQLIVDPSRIYMKDLTDGGPGKIIRVRPQAYGQDVNTMLKQLPIVDVTASHLPATQFVAELIQRALGVNDNIMGQVNPGGRKTATEVRTSSSFGINRLKTFSEYNSALGWAPLAQMMLQNTQQEFDGERMFKVAGDLLQPNTNFVNVTPDDILGFFDFVPVDGTMPIDRFAQANMWKEILLGMEKMPMIAMQYDLAGIFSWMAQLAGLKNITQFRLQVAPDQVVQAQAQAGNLLPASQAGAPKGTDSAGTGMGPTLQ